MQSKQWPGPRIGEDRPIEGIQPGGGFCIGLEQRWGRWRRWWLRRFRPRYVAQMREKRRGSCTDCAHDIIDGRDLKLLRNVCGYRFDAADDRFAYRDNLGLARSGLAEVVFATALMAAAMACLGGAALASGSAWPWLASLPLWVVYYQAVRFFRDPARSTPTQANALISPSDGVVTDLHEIDDADFPGGRAFRISIYLSPWDVHLNRNPTSGTVSAVRYFPGRFLNARHKACAIQNEQLWVDLLDDGGRTVRVKQISGAMARRLVCWLKPGERVVAGERYGMIKYGSRADVLIPIDANAVLIAKVGDRVYAGETILIAFEE